MVQIYKTIFFDPKQQKRVFDRLIKYAIAPRPICFASTINNKGNINLSPFSYFNLVSHQPPICIFSPLRRMGDEPTKHTLKNIQEVPEVVINIVNYAIVQQQSLASTEYAKGINEFEKAGLTSIPSIHISPPRVAESPVQLECKVNEVIVLGDESETGNLVVAEILAMHIHQHLLNEDNRVAQEDLDLVARLGGEWYCRVTKDNLFKVSKPLKNLGIGVDQLPKAIRLSTVLTGNHLGILGNIESIPTVNPNFQDEFIKNWSGNIEEAHQYAAQLINHGETHRAWQILLRLEP